MIIQEKYLSTDRSACCCFITQHLELPLYMISILKGEQISLSGALA